jgi:hypothetical protein
MYIFNFYLSYHKPNLDVFNGHKELHPSNDQAAGLSRPALRNGHQQSRLVSE